MEWVSRVVQFSIALFYSFVLINFIFSDDNEEAWTSARFVKYYRQDYSVQASRKIVNNCLKKR